MTTQTAARHGRAAVAGALSLLVLHAGAHAGWMIDDAGITFAYARNLANGHGLVPQPGAPAVEGYSNPLWTLLIAVLYAARLFVLPFTPKVLGVALAAGVLWVVYRDLSSRASAGRIAWTLLLIAVCTPFVIWTTSGLENGLLACLVAFACANTLASVDAHEPGRRDLRAGVLGALLGLTRPDAVLYTAAHVAVVVAAEWTRGRGFVVRTAKRAGATAAGFVPLYVGHLLFRLSYFGDIVPNTYHAKQKPSVAGLLSPGKLVDLLESALADFAWMAPVFVLVCAVVLVRMRRVTMRQVTLAAYLSVATVVYLVMPPDWMGEFRFATAFFPLLYWTLGELWTDTARAVGLAPRLKTSMSAVAILCLLQAGVVFAARTAVFRENPPVPLESIRRYGAQGFAQLASLLGASDASVLTSDLGGMLLESPQRVIDLAGLCDRTVARAISIDGDPERLHRYVFEETRPTFMHVVGTFVRLSRFHTDPRFERDYVSIYESSASAPPDWPVIWRTADRVPPFLGDYVRRDVLGGDLARLEVLRAAYRRGSMERSVAPYVMRREGVGVKRPLSIHAAATLRDALVPAGAVALPAGAH